VLSFIISESSVTKWNSIGNSGVQMLKSFIIRLSFLLEERSRLEQVGLQAERHGNCRGSSVAKLTVFLESCCSNVGNMHFKLARPLLS
jgi:hypothetical protein